MALLSYPSMAPTMAIQSVGEAVAALPGASPADADADADAIAFDAFVRAFAYRVTAMGSSGEMALRVAFEGFDADGDGRLTNAEFRDALARLAPVPMEDAVMNELIADLDANGDGEIHVDEWIAFLRQRLLRAICGDALHSSSR